MPFFVEFSCGCRLEHNQCYRVHDRGLRMCHDHKEATIENMVFVCEICGKEQVIEKFKTNAKKYCSKACLTIAARSYKYIRGGTKNHIPIHEPIPKPDCRYYLSKCLLEVCRDPNEKAVRCNFCPRYEKEDMNILEYECGSGEHDATNYNYIPIDFNKHARKIITHNEKQAGKKNRVEGRKAQASYLWGYQHTGRKKAIDKAKERIQEYANK